MASLYGKLTTLRLRRCDAARNKLKMPFMSRHAIIVSFPLTTSTTNKMGMEKQKKHHTTPQYTRLEEHPKRRANAIKLFSFFLVCVCGCYAFFFGWEHDGEQKEFKNTN